ncbi:hypothetical protein AB0M87_07095 [Streptomyces sp. NPDC051320]|uniref:hypothetical protein n=1 Tax=Streptomyces sp. NPDC051320 TaxID=3154644 RepID=UPI00341925CE
MDQALNDMDASLDRLRKKTDDTDVSKAVDDLGTAVEHVRASADSGDRAPDLSPVSDAASELTQVCTS